MSGTPKQHEKFLISHAYYHASYNKGKLKNCHLRFSNNYQVSPSIVSLDDEILVEIDKTLESETVMIQGFDCDVRVGLPLISFGKVIIFVSSIEEKDKWEKSISTARNNLASRRKKPAVRVPAPDPQVITT